MKIFPVNFIQHPVQIQSRAIVFRGNNINSNNGDSFEKSNDSHTVPEQRNIFKTVLENPVLRQRFMSLMAYGAAIAAVGAGSEDDSEIAQESDNIMNFLRGIFSTPQQTQAKPVKPVNKENVSTVPVPEEEKDLIKIDFPKKRGRLSKINEQLKKVITNIEVTPQTAQKASLLCDNLIKNKSINYRGDELKSETVSKILLDNLTQATGREQKEQVISNIFEDCNLTLSKKTPDISPDLDMPEPKEAESIFEEKNPVMPEDSVAINAQTAKPAVKIVGNIDLEKIDPSHKRQRIYKPAQKINYSETETDYGTPAIVERPVLGQSEGDFTSYTIQFPGTVYEDLSENLAFIMRSFEKRRAEKDLRWVYRKPMGKITTNDLRKEINGNRLKFGVSSGRDFHQYNNINNNNIDEVVNAINADDRFAELFTVHSAARLIDRFIDFNNNELSIEQQCHILLDALEKLVQKAAKEGNIIVDDYKADTYRGNYHGAVIKIPEEFFINNKRAANIFGTNDLIIGLCENQPNSHYYNKYNKKALIQTIYPSGI